MSEDRAAEYRRKAEECREQAQRSPRDEDKAEWRRLAEQWQQLADRITYLRGRNPPRK